jgi:hypothetical protein
MIRLAQKVSLFHRFFPRLQLPDDLSWKFHHRQTRSGGISFQQHLALAPRGTGCKADSGPIFFGYDIYYFVDYYIDEIFGI